MEVLVGIYIVGVASGLLLSHRLRRKRLPRPEVEWPPRLEHKAYAEERRWYIDRYDRSMAQFDRLIPWGTGGALVLSVTMISKAEASSLTMWIVLEISWAFLLVALTASVLSHFTSARASSSRRALLDLGQKDETAEGKNRLQEHNRIVDRSGRATWLLNWTAAITFPAGILSMVVYALLYVLKL